jgi:replicative DNA helicase
MTTIDNPPAAAADSERQILGAVLNRADTLDELRLCLDGSEFWRPIHTDLWAVMCDLADTRITPDVQAVVAELARRGKLGPDGTIALYVNDLWTGCATAANAGWHVRQVRDAAKLRAVQRAHTRLGQILGEHAGDTDVTLDAVARQAVALELAVDASDDAAVPGVQTWQDFTTATDAPRWIVPGLLRRHDTILVLGASGVGKSFLSRQVAICLAAGLHPFTLKRIEPVRTLLVDLENAPDQVAEDAVGTLTGAALIAGGDTGQRGWIWPQPEGLDLRKRGDARLLERVIAQTQPQVLCMGSLYNAYRRGSDGWDEAAEDVQAVLKRLRGRYGLALWLEHHMPRAAAGGHTGSPYGGVRWEQWPTHGRRLSRADCPAPVFLLQSTFRGDRGARDLPLAFKRGGRLPLTAIFDQAELDEETTP